MNYLFTSHMYNEDLALNNLRELICHKTQPNDLYEIIAVFGFKNIVLKKDEN